MGLPVTPPNALMEASLMKQANTLVTGITAITLLSAAACSHPRVAANKPAEIAPVATATPQPTRTPVTATKQPAPPSGTTQIATQAKQTNMPASVRKTLDEELAKLED